MAAPAGSNVLSNEGDRAAGRAPHPLAQVSQITLGVLKMPHLGVDNS